MIGNASVALCLGRGFLSGIALLLLAQPASAGVNRWTTQGPYTGSGALAIDPRNPAVLSLGHFGNGVFKTVDGGLSWHPASRGLGNSVVLAVAVDPNDSNVVFAGVCQGQACTHVHSRLLYGHLHRSA